MERLHIDLNEHSYDILTGHGLLDQAGTLIRRVWSGSRAVVLTDDTVRDLYGSRLEQSLSAAGISAAVFSVAPGEQSKSMKVLEHLLDFMASHGLTRSDLLIVLGGAAVVVVIVVVVRKRKKAKALANLEAEDNDEDI